MTKEQRREKMERILLDFRNDCKHSACELILPALDALEALMPIPKTVKELIDDLKSVEHHTVAEELWRVEALMPREDDSCDDIPSPIMPPKKIYKGVWLPQEKYDELMKKPRECEVEKINDKTYRWVKTKPQEVSVDEMVSYYHTYIYDGDLDKEGVRNLFQAIHDRVYGGK